MSYLYKPKEKKASLTKLVSTFSELDFSGFLADSASRAEAGGQTITATLIKVIFPSDVSSEVLMDQARATNVGHKDVADSLTSAAVFVNSFVVFAVSNTGEEACDQA